MNVNLIVSTLQTESNRHLQSARVYDSAHLKRHGMNGSTAFVHEQHVQTKLLNKDKFKLRIGLQPEELG